MVSGGGCGVGDQVAVSFAGAAAGSGVVGADEAFSVAVTVPPGTVAGSYEVEVLGCGPEALDAPVAVVSTTLTASDGVTRSSPGEPLLRSGVVIAGAAVMLLLAARRRQTVNHRG